MQLLTTLRYFILFIDTVLSTGNGTSSPIGSLIARLKVAEQPAVDQDITYSCRTTNNSATVSDVLKAALMLYDRGAGVQCRQYRLTGSKCTKLVTSGDAVINLCGNTGQWLECRRAGVASVDFITMCEGFVDGRWRVGGYMNISSERVSIVI